MRIVTTRRNYLESLNPLRNLTPAQAVMLIEHGMQGNYTLLQWYYNTIEQADPDLLALVERRLGAINEMDWNVKNAKGEMLNAEENLKAAYDRIENLQEAIGHLALATFRGYSICQLQDAAGNPAAPGEATRLYCIPHWNLVRDGIAGAWKLNPDAKQQGFRNLPDELELDPVRDRLIIRECARPVDRVGLVKFIRSNYSQKAWSDFCEKCAQDGVFIIMPPEIPEGRAAEYESTAEDAAAGGGGALPYQTDVKFANSLRGTGLPFEGHMRFLREQLVLAATGGMLTMLAEPTGIGQGATSAHADAFQTLARAEAKAISEALQRGFDRPYFGAEKSSVYFELAYREETDAGSIIDHALKLAQAGFQMDPAELSEKTGYTLTEKPFSGGVGSQTGHLIPSSLPGAAAPFAMNKEQARMTLTEYIKRAEAVMDIADPKEREKAGMALVAESGAVLREMSLDKESEKLLADYMRGAALFGMMNAEG